MAIVAPGRPHADRKQLGDRAESSGVLARLLADSAAVEPDRPAFRDGPGRQIWSGRPSLELNRTIASEAVRRLAAYLTGLGLGQGTSVGICLPNGSEAVMSILAVGEAGLTPCLLDVTASAGELSSAIEVGDVRAVITQARLGPDRLAEKLCFVAAGFFRLRFLLAFGPEVPDGVVDLDPVLLEPRSARPHAAWAEDGGSVPGLISFVRGSAGRKAVHRTYRSLIAATVPIVAAARLRPGERLITFLPPDDLKGLATGAVAGIIAGATVETHCVFDSATLADALARDEPSHIVLPGWMEPTLAEFEASPFLRSVILTHEAPVQLKGRVGAPSRIVDVFCCAELGLLSSARAQADEISFTTLCSAARDGSEPPLLQIRLSDDNEICLRGPAVAVGSSSPAHEGEWQPSGFRVEQSGSAIVGLA